MKIVKKQKLERKKANNIGDGLLRGKFNIVRGAHGADMDEVKAALNEIPQCINSQDPYTKMTALHWAGANRDLELAEYLFAWEPCKADPWIKDKWGRLPVQLAIETGNKTLIQLFHEKMFPEDYQNDYDVFDPPEGVIPNITPKPL